VRLVSPDLTNCNYFLWGYLKDAAYENHPRTTEWLKINMAKAIEDIFPHILFKISTNQVSLGVNGGHFQHLM
jgi:hypothetical protein